MQKKNEAQLVTVTQPTHPRMRITLECNDPGKTHQEFKDSCNINLLVKSWKRGTPISHLNNRSAQFGDFTEGSDFKTALDQVLYAQDSFMELPSAVRDAVGNSPAAFLDAINDPDKLKILESMGLDVELHEEAPQPAPAAPTVAPKSDGPLKGPGSAPPPREVARRRNLEA